METTEFCQVVTTVDDRACAVALAESAVTARLAACGQVGGPISSTYRWGGAVERAEEWTVTFKTTVTCAPALEDHIRAGHPYEVPEILRTPVTGGNPHYLAWIAQETAQG